MVFSRSFLLVNFCVMFKSTEAFNFQGKHFLIKIPFFTFIFTNKMEFIPMRIKVKRIDEPRLDDPIRTALETFLNPVKENLELEATTSATPLMSAAASTSTDTQAIGSKKNIIKCLSEQHALRDKNRLIYGCEKNEGSQLHAQGSNISLKVEDKATVVPYYKFARGTSFVEFAITYDNKIFFASGAGVGERQRIQTYGTLLKAVGCMQLDKKVTLEGTEVPYEKVEEIIKYISVHNTGFTAHPDNIAVSLFVLRQLGLDLSATKVIVPNKLAKRVSETNPDCRIDIQGEIKEAGFYLDERRFPAAKAMASGTELTIPDKMAELFYSIDDEILSKRNEKIIKEVERERMLLKLTIIKLIRRELFPRDEKDEEETNLGEVLMQGSLQEENTANSHYVAINKIIHSFKENHIDLAFLSQEILYLLSFKLQKGGLIEVEKKALDTWLASIEKIPGRRFDLADKNFHAWIRFYDETPVKTCIALLKDYSKGEGLLGMVMRLLSGAWNRNYKDPVNKVLSMDKNKEFPDNMDITYLFERLKESGLIFNPDASSKSRLRKILLFCAHLQGERAGLEQLIASSLVFFPPYPKSRFSFFRIDRQASDGMYRRLTQVTDDIGNASHGETMVDASAWPTADESELERNMTQQTSANTTLDESFELNEEPAQYRQSTPREASFLGGVSDSSCLSDKITEKTTVESDSEDKLSLREQGSPPYSRPSSVLSGRHSRSPSLYFVSASSSHVGCVSPNELEEADNSDEPSSSESFRTTF